MEQKIIKIKDYLHERKEDFIQISHQIHQNPEIANEEYFACQILSDTLKDAGFDVTVNVAGHETGFVARKAPAKPGPVIGILAEYDALAGLGHGCGHNIIGTSSVAAGCALAQIIDEVGGEVVVFGTPAEEGGDNGSAKGSFVREGLFKDVDVCMMIHPGNKTTVTAPSLANHPIEFEFLGRPAHASGYPEKGINALDAMIVFYNAVNALRQQVTPDVRIHGIITHGGDAPNIIPEYTKARFYVRANTIKTCEEVTERVIKAAEGAALSTGCTLKHTTYQNIVEDLIYYPKFNELFEEIATKLGHQVEALDPRGSRGSTDAGNVSQVVPTIHPSLKICEPSVAGHTKEFKEAAISKQGDQAVLDSAEILARISLELLLDSQKLKAIKEEFELLKAE
ncbi:MAG: M20 family metallopeptidase [Turicibacter sp.]|nr:M20 family metallopeptidase [Turicibacter sp.]